MNAVIWARVSSREQREGYSIDAQLRATRDKAQREGWTIIREFAVAESAKRGAERLAFNEMYQWVRQNAGKMKIEAVLSHKLDRICRNMRDAVRMQELEDTCGVKLVFTENQFAPGAAGMLSFNVMAAVAQYYSDNLRTEVMKGQNEKVLQGWLPCGVPFGYMNVENHDEPIQPHPEQAQAVIRMFDLYARGNLTFETLSEQLWREGHVYRSGQTKFGRTGLSYILNNRFYIGEINYRGQTHPGRHKPLVSRQLFQACQDVLAGKTRRTNNRNHPLAGGVFTCAYCGSMITGELIRRSLRNGEVREHLYYRCANNHPNHPTVRWKAEDLEQAIHEDLASMKLDAELAEWFRRSLAAAFADTDAQQQRQHQMLLKRRTELANMQDRLLSAYLSSNIDDVTFQNKSVGLKAQLGEMETALQSSGGMNGGRGETALALFNWSQQAADVWLGSKMDLKREILGEIALNRTLSDVTLCLEKRRPFDILVKRPSVQPTRGDKI